MNTAFVPEDYFAQYGVAQIFGAGETCEVDLGCGDGGFLLAMAEHYPKPASWVWSDFLAASARCATRAPAAG